MLDLVDYSRLFQWLLYPYNMYFSSYNYYNTCFIRRAMVQKHGQPAPLLSSVTLEVANSNLTSVEDIEVLHSLRVLELLVGQKAVLAYTGSRYVGTSKKSYFFASVTLQKQWMYPFLLFLTLFLLPNLQKLGGRFTSEWVRGSTFSISCKDPQLFEGYFAEPLNSNLKVTIKAKNSSVASFLDILQTFKFNIYQ